jgi:pimeloyl-ACP methyl ester carboxylesterase
MSNNTKVRNGNVTLPVTRIGEGQPIIFFNGGGATQISWKKTIEQLQGNYEKVTFDFRSHGKATTADDHSFNAFLSDAEAVMSAIKVRRPIIVAWSLGADLAVSYAANHPGEITGLVLVDGAVPLTEPLVDDEERLRRSLNSPIMKFSKLLIRLTPYNYRISGDAYADITLELDKRRQTSLLDDYSRVDCSIAMVLATKSAGVEGVHAERNNKLWREGVERLVTKYPSITTRWVEGTHSLPFKHPADIASAIVSLAQQS